MALARTCAGLLILAAASPFEPHPAQRDGPWFEGWFTRIVDPEQQTSLAVIVGTFQQRGSRDFSSTWAAALLAFPNGTMVTEQAFPDQRSVKITDRGEPVRRRAPREQTAVFEVRSELGSLAVNGSSAELDLLFPSGLRITASLRDRVPWDPGCPDTCGPEGWAARLPSGLLPTHYFVHTLASRASYAAAGVRGAGFAHQEANYGGFFPSAWIWVQGIAADGASQLVLTGGGFTVAGLELRQFLLAVRTPTRAWNLRGIDGDAIRATVEACQSRLALRATSLLGSRRVELTVQAASRTFSEPLFIPTPTGWSNRPGSIESYAAVASVQLFEHGRLVETRTLPQTALEFGGTYRCDPDKPVLV